MENINEKPFKLNYKRTTIIGFAFFGILLLWQVYDLSCSKILSTMFMKLFNTDRSEDVQYLVGIMMAIDNLAALLLLPLFGKLSDRTHTRIGKRMPYILIGTFFTAVAFPFIPVFFHFNSLAGVITMMAIVVLFSMMYRNPAVALMPDVTPKPLRSKANGLINIMGYVGGFIGTLFTIFFSLSHYLGEKDYTGYQLGQLWVVEMPFLLGSLFMIISAVVLFILVKENKIAKEVEDEMRRGELYSDATDKEGAANDDKPMSKANKITLWLILIAEFFWFMADNGVSTFFNNYITYHAGGETVDTSYLTIVMGVGSVIGFVLGGFFASKITRKWTLVSGLGLTLTAYTIWAIIGFSGGIGGASVPLWLYFIYFAKGLGMSLVHVNSYPMVVELCSGKKVGMFTGYYYTSSMLAQSITPILLGLLLLNKDFSWSILPLYAAICSLVALIVFLIVKNSKKKVDYKVGLENMDVDD